MDEIMKELDVSTPIPVPYCLCSNFVISNEKYLDLQIEKKKKNVDLPKIISEISQYRACCK